MLSTRESRRNENTIWLEGANGTFVLRRNWKGREKTWLLTGYNEAPSADRTMDIADRPPKTARGDDTAPPSQGAPGPDFTTHPEESKPQFATRDMDLGMGSEDHDAFDKYVHSINTTKLDMSHVDSPEAALRAILTGSEEPVQPR